MTESHNYSFFKGDTGLIITSSSRDESFFFMKCIRMKQNGKWERPSLKEGITIKIGLEELSNILSVFKGKKASWSTIHEFRRNKTTISFALEEDDTITISVEKFRKTLDSAQTGVLKELLKHLFKEKVKYATGTNKPRSVQQYRRELLKSSKLFNTKALIEGETEKALLLSFISSGKQKWIPKSVIHSTYDSQLQEIQDFLIDSWIIKQSNLLEQDRKYRQGDVMLKEIDSLPSNLVAKKDGVVAEGEQTGHAHIIEYGAVFETITQPSKLYVVANKDSKITHDEHHPINLKEGFYEVIIQKEFLGWGKENPQESMEYEVSD